jgi:hypothetical protein
MLTGREAVADEIKAWSVNFSKRAESQDVGAVRLALRGVKDSDEGRETFEKAIAAGFAGRRYAYRLEATASAELEARLVIALAGPPMERFAFARSGWETRSTASTGCASTWRRRGRLGTASTRRPASRRSRSACRPG